jgi:class 3 adenylate cyclase
MPLPPASTTTSCSGNFSPSPSCFTAQHWSTPAWASGHSTGAGNSTGRQSSRCIGIHGGEVIIGDIGYRNHMVFTALGDAVNVAARLQDMTKSLACEAIVSDEVRITAGLAADALPEQQVAIRGRTEPMTVHAVASARILSTLVDDLEDIAA